MGVTLQSIEQRTAPVAIFAYLIAGVARVITAASAAELATGMPTSGSVLMTRRYLPDHRTIKANEGLKRLKESAGLTTSSEENECV